MLILFSFISFHLFYFCSVDLIARDLCLIVEFFFSFSRFSFLLFLDLILEEAFEHVFFLVHSKQSFLLFFGHFLLKLL